MGIRIPCIHCGTNEYIDAAGPKGSDFNSKNGICFSRSRVVHGCNAVEIMVGENVCCSNPECVKVKENIRAWEEKNPRRKVTWTVDEVKKYSRSASFSTTTPEFFARLPDSVRHVYTQFMTDNTGDKIPPL